jgi:hypothetical protein
LQDLSGRIDGNPSYRKRESWIGYPAEAKEEGSDKNALLMQVAWGLSLAAAFQPSASRMGCNNLGTGCGKVPAQEAAEMAPEDLEETMRRLEDQWAHMEKASTGP